MINPRIFKARQHTISICDLESSKLISLKPRSIEIINAKNIRIQDIIGINYWQTILHENQKLRFSYTSISDNIILLN